MAGSMSRYLEKQFLEVFGGGTSNKAKTFTALTESWVALGPTAWSPTNAWKGGAGEVNDTAAEIYTGYTRQKIKETEWELVVEGATSYISNKNVITFPENSGAESAELKYIFLMSAEAVKTGEMYVYGELSSGKKIAKNVTPSFAAKELKFELT